MKTVARSFLAWLGTGLTLCVASPTPEVVVLLHGWWAPPFMMFAVQRRLAHRGYRVINVGYPSVTVPLEELAGAELPRRLSRRLPADAARVHFVTHSMGGLVLRRYLELHPLPALGRVVMIAPPNRGSELADRWLKIPGILHVSGPNLAQLATGSPMASAADRPVAYELGVLAGTSAPFTWASPLPEPHDGKVSVAGTRLAGMKAHQTVSCSHSFLPWHSRVLDEIEAFLGKGEFLARTLAETPAPIIP